MVRILVTGGRDFDDENFLFTTLDQLHHEEHITQLIHGAARGADSLASDWANLRGIKSLPCPANWKLFGRAAGTLRNKQMLEDFKPDLVLAFPGGSGTRHMIGIAQKAGIRVVLAAAGS